MAAVEAVCQQGPPRHAKGSSDFFVRAVETVCQQGAPSLTGDVDWEAAGWGLGVKNGSFRLFVVFRSAGRGNIKAVFCENNGFPLQTFCSCHYFLTLVPGEDGEKRERRQLGLEQAFPTTECWFIVQVVERI